MQLNILGPPELLGESRRVSVQPQLWCVLISLILVPGAPVSIDIIIDHLWGSGPPPKAKSTMRSYIWRLERALSEAAGAEIRIARRGRGYALELEPLVVDLHRSRALRQRAATLAKRGEKRRALIVLRQAESLWHGVPLAGLASEWIGGVRLTLEEELRSLIKRRVELELMLGRHVELLSELAELTGRYPDDEALIRYRMLALFGADRQSDALLVYREAVARLAEDGLDPTQGLIELHQRILRHDPALVAPPDSERAPFGPPPDTLPRMGGEFVGRTAEVQVLMDARGDWERPIVNVIEGTGGAGKTALAVHMSRKLATNYPDGQLYLNFRAHDPELAPLDPADATRDLLTMLGVDEAGHDTTERVDRWHNEVAARRLVMIFDDVTGPEQVWPLIPEEGDCFVIVTSRHHLDWGTAGVVPLGALSDEDAVTLFVNTAGRVATEHLGQVAVATKLCGFLPLAISLAAGCIRSGEADFDDLLRELKDLSSGHDTHSDLSVRLARAFDMTYRRLPEREQRFFRWLGAGPCVRITPSIAAVLTGTTEAEAQVSLAMLRECHLLEESSGRGYGLHDVVRSYAVARSAREDSWQDIHHAIGQLADHYLSAATGATQALHARAQGQERGGIVTTRPDDTPRSADEEAAAWLSAEWDNALRIAEYCGEHGDKRRCVALVLALTGFLEVSGYWDRGIRVHSIALALSRDTNDPRSTAMIAFALSLMCLRTGQVGAALEYASEAATAYAEAGDQNGRALALDRVGIAHRHASRFRESLAYHREAMGIFRATGDSRGMAKALLHAAAALFTLGRHSEQMNYLTEALGIFRQEGDLRGQGLTLNNIGLLQHIQGLHKDAVRSYQEARDIFSGIGGRQNIAILDQNMGEIYHYKGDLAEAIALYRKALAELRRLGDLRQQAFVLIDIGSLYRDEGSFAEAKEHAERAVAFAEKVGDLFARGLALCVIADAEFRSGRTAAASEYYESAGQIAAEIESPWIKASALNGMAEVAFRARRTEDARILWRASHDIFIQLGVYEAATVALRLELIGDPVSGVKVMRDTPRA